VAHHQGGPRPIFAKLIVVQRPASLLQRVRGFTLLEVALIVAIIGMMMFMIIGYLLAPKPKESQPSIEAPALAKPAASATPAKTIELPADSPPTSR
jgi:hypothetical protein